ncbi:hypothetical protein Tco_0723015 [Tanacetum coccineum]
MVEEPAKVDANYQLAQRLQAEEQEQFTTEQKATLFKEYIEQRRKHFAAKREKEKRNKPPTQAQQRKIICTYLKNMEGKKPKDLKNKSFNSIQKMFDKAFKRVNTFVDFRIDLVEGSSKRAGEELEQESIKKQKVDEDKETIELQSLTKVIPDEEEVAIDVVPLATKPPTIVDWKIHKEGKKSLWKVINVQSLKAKKSVKLMMEKLFRMELELMLVTQRFHKVSTAGAIKDTASEEVPIVSTAEVNLSTAGGTVTYTRRSEEKRTRKDKGKAIMIESEPKKKSKKELEQERLSFAEAIRLEEQMNEEQRAQIARDEEIARQWDEEERQRAMAEAKSTKKIDWNDPSVIRYHTLKMKPKTVAQARKNMIKYLKNQGNYKISDFKGMSYNEIRPIFEKVWDFNQNIEPMNVEHGSEKKKSPEKSPKKMKSPEKIEEEDVATQKEMKEVSKETGAKRKKSIPRKSTRKRQKMEEDAEKEELKGFLDIIPREEVPIEVESLYTKFPVVDWKTCVLTENFMYYQVFRGDGSSKNYKVLSEMQ